MADIFLKLMISINSQIQEAHHTQIWVSARKMTNWYIVVKLLKGKFKKNKVLKAARGKKTVYTGEQE